MKWLYRLTWIYLILPFILFSLGWMRLFVGLPLALAMVWALWRLWKDAARSMEAAFPRLAVSALALTGAWVLLSGIGGYAFQNYDFHGRNAILRDLIVYDWPVYYSEPERGPVKMLVYYVGYWLPAALAGKMLGWNFANLFLFLWTWLGVLLTVLHLSALIETSLLKAALALILFSGMDAVGTVLFAREYPTLWPPIQHLEIWAVHLQFSSFTTQLFWVFNQAVPAWLCISVFLSMRSPVELASARADVQWLSWALCFFFAPLISAGLLPYLLIEWLEGARKNLGNFLRGLRPDLLAAGILVLSASYLYFSSNTAAQERGWQSLAWAEALRFFLIEAGHIWLVLGVRRWRDPRWVATGLLLFLAPFVQFGGGRDFVMRASIAPLFLLMVWCGAEVFARGTPRLVRIILLLALALGALTPLYEINRSAYRTFAYYFLLDENQRVQPDPEPATHLEQGGAPEAEHPGSLLADDILTLAFLNDKLSRNYVANVRGSLYYRFIAPR